MLSLSEEPVRQAILQRLSRLQPGTQRVWGVMTAPQMVCHLNDSFLLALGEKKAALRSGFLRSNLLKPIALYLPAPWPKGIKTLPEVEQGRGGTSPTVFAQDVETLVRSIHRFCKQDPQVGQHPHPFFLVMTPSQWMRWGYLHCDHHLRQFGL